MSFDSGAAPTKLEGLVYISSEHDVSGCVQSNPYVPGLRLLREPIDGVYVPTVSLGASPVADPQLALEFECWEAASDEALARFEAELD